eukprot:6182489-Pleurochrysis_carterae.AAC.3
MLLRSGAIRPIKCGLQVVLFIAHGVSRSQHAAAANFVTTAELLGARSVTTQVPPDSIPYGTDGKLVRTVAVTIRPSHASVLLLWY